MFGFTVVIYMVCKAQDADKITVSNKGGESHAVEQQSISRSQCQAGSECHEDGDCHTGGCQPQTGVQWRHIRQGCRQDRWKHGQKVDSVRREQYVRNYQVTNDRKEPHPECGSFVFQMVLNLLLESEWQQLIEFHALVLTHQYFCFDIIVVDLIHEFPAPAAWRIDLAILTYRHDLQYS